MNNTYSTALPPGLERLKLALKAIPVKRILKVSGAFLVLIIRLSFTLLVAALTLGAHILDAANEADKDWEKDRDDDFYIDPDTGESSSIRGATNYNARTGL